jgi:hypothetical protein
MDDLAEPDWTSPQSLRLAAARCRTRGLLLATEAARYERFAPQVTPIPHDPFADLAVEDEATRERRGADFAAARVELAEQQIRAALADEERQAAERKRSAFKTTGIGRLL